MQENPIWNQIETYIRDHRDELDVDEPRVEVWDNIAQQLPGQTRPLWLQRQVWRAAAIIALALGLSYWWYVRLDEGLPQQIGADLGHTTSGEQGEWDQLSAPHQAEIDSLLQVHPEATEAVQRIGRRLDSLQETGAPTPARLDLYESLRSQQRELLTQPMH